jgi:hypothetical protein
MIGPTDLLHPSPAHFRLKYFVYEIKTGHINYFFRTEISVLRNCVFHAALQSGLTSKLKMAL